MKPPLPSKKVRLVSSSVLFGSRTNHSLLMDSSIFCKKKAGAQVCIAFAGLFIFFGCLEIATCEQFFSAASSMDIKYKLWLDMDYVSCTRACTGRGHKLGHRLYTSCRSRGEVKHNLYDFDDGTVYMRSGDKGMWTVKKPIPKAQKGEPVILAAFCVEGDHNISELESWISSLVENKVLNVEGKEWHTDVTVSLEGHDYRCTMTTTLTRRTTLSPYCEDDTQRVDCPPVPHTAWIKCGSRFIRYSFGNYTKKFNQSAFQLPQKREDATTTDPQEIQKPAQDFRANCYSESTVIGLSIGMGLLFVLVIVLAVVCFKQRCHLAAAKKRNRHLAPSQQSLLDRGH